MQTAASGDVFVRDGSVNFLERVIAAKRSIFDCSRGCSHYLASNCKRFTLESPFGLDNFSLARLTHDASVEALERRESFARRKQINRCE
jgi:hypothetical protein